jgi:hypothetical protein
MQSNKVFPKLLTNGVTTCLCFSLLAAGEAADKVIALGDSLFGSTVTNLFLGPDALNNSGQISFTADLEDSNGNTTRFVLRADPVSQEVPEPSSALGVLAFSAFGIVSRLLGK